MMRISVLSLLSIVLAITAIAAQLPAQESVDSVELTTAMSQWLEDSWAPTTESEQELSALRGQLRASSSAWDRYALGVAFLKHREYRDAEQQFDSAIKLEPGNTRLLRAFLYSKVLVRDPRPATARLSEFAEAAMATSKDRPVARLNEDIEFLGIMTAFLGLPSTAGVNAGELSRQIGLIEERLTDEQLELFTESRDDVRRIYESLIVEKVVEREIASDAAERERERQLIVLAEESDRLVDGLNDLEPRIAQVRADRADALDEIREKDEPLSRDLASLTGELAALERELWDLDRRAALLILAARSEPDRGLRRRYRLDADRLLFLAADVEADVIAVRAQAAAVANQRLLVQQEYLATQAEFDNQLAGMNADWQQLRRLQTVNEAKTQRFMKPAKASSGKAESFAQKARTLATYFEFPLESERLWLIESAAAKALSEKPKPVIRDKEDDAGAKPAAELKLDGRIDSTDKSPIDH